MVEVKKVKHVVLGAGPGGYPAAFYLADHSSDNDQVAIIEPRKNPGGVCVYEGCIPSKALLHVAHIIETAKESELLGVSYPAPKIDIAKVRAFKEQVVSKLTNGTGQLTKSRGIEHIHGHGKLIDKNNLIVERESKDVLQVEFENLIIATGSRPIITLPFLEPFLQKDKLSFTNSRLWTSREALALDFDKPPKSLLVIGGGYIGLELASVYQALGSQVTVIERLPALAGGGTLMDMDLVRRLEMKLKKSGIQFLMECEVQEIKQSGEGLKIIYSQLKDKQTQEKSFDNILVSIGRQPNSDQLALEKAGISTDQRGFIPVNGQRQTKIRNICAIGDVAGGLLLAHKASHEGICAAQTNLGKKSAFHPYAIPAVIYTNPEIATTGLNEIEAKKQKIAYKSLIFPFAASGRAVSISQTTGFTKIIAEEGNGRILGMAIVGPHAGEMISEGTLAIEMGATVDDIAATIHPHPTLSETIMEAAELFSGSCTHLPKKRR